jgi:hypothetical protein
MIVERCTIFEQRRGVTGLDYFVTVTKMRVPAGVNPPRVT